MLGLRFADESTLECDMVVISAGIKANWEIAAGCGLTIERGIVVDDQMRCVDDRDIYAVGECAQHRGQMYGLVAPLWEQAKVLADHITGANARAAYHGSKVATKLKVMGVEVASMGIVEPQRSRGRGGSILRTEAGYLQEADHPRRPAGRRDSAGRHQQGGLSDAGVRPQHAAAGRAPADCCST